MINTFRRIYVRSFSATAKPSLIQSVINNIEGCAQELYIVKQKFLDKQIITQKEKQTASYPLLSDFIADWLKVKKQTVKESTYNSYVNLLSRNILPKR